MQHWRFCGMAILFVLLFSVQTTRADVIIRLSAGEVDRFSTPVAFELPASLNAHRHFTLTRLDINQDVPVQVTREKNPRLMWLLQNPLAAGKTRRYRISPAKKPPATKGVVTVEDDGKRIRVTVGQKPVLVYSTAVVPSPDRKEPYYDRSGYIHPLYNPRGQVVTDDFAPDHPHQHGIMFPWTNTKFEGRKVNFWDQKDGQGKIEHAKVESQFSGPVFGEFKVRLNHIDINQPDKPKPVLTETWQVRVFNLTDHFLFDLEFTQRSTGSPLEIQKYHYGGFAIRGHRNWLTPGQGDFLTSEGKTRKNGNHSRPHWVDIHGNVDGETTGVTIFCDPGNFRSPQHVRLHPNKPYFCFAPMVAGDFQIQIDKPYVTRYRLFVHNGKLDPKVAERHWRDIANPPVVDIIDRENRDRSLNGKSATKR